MQYIYVISALILAIAVQQGNTQEKGFTPRDHRDYAIT